MLNLTFEQLVNAQFKLYEGNPVIRCFGASTIVADPSLLTPDLTPDGKWRLYAHTLTGVHGFVSDDGISFRHTGRILSRAMRPDINKVGDRYLLFYERLQPLLPRAASLLGGKWVSDIYVVESKDLTKFSEPRPVLRFGSEYERVGKKGHSVSNPFLLPVEDGYRLYYSAGLTYIPDCRFDEPTYICCAQSKCPDRDFVRLPEPIIRPDDKPTGDKVRNAADLCCGCLKVYRLADCYVGLQNGIYDDNGQSKSAIRLLRSDDGLAFSFVKTLLAPQMCGDSDWMAQFVYASHLVCTGDKLRLYFNARNTANILAGREHIGFAEAEIPKA